MDRTTRIGWGRAGALLLAIVVLPWLFCETMPADTGNDDDVAFNPRKKYSFAMALFDNSGDEDSYDSEVITLQFKK